MYFSFGGLVELVVAFETAIEICFFKAFSDAVEDAILASLFGAKRSFLHVTGKKVSVIEHILEHKQHSNHCCKC